MPILSAVFRWLVLREYGQAVRLSERGYGEIGRHARFRFWCRKAWEFKSLYPHQNKGRPGLVLGVDREDGAIVLAKRLQNCVKPLPANGSAHVLARPFEGEEHSQREMKV